MDSGLLMMREQSHIVIVAQCFVREMNWDRMAIPAKRKGFFGFFIEQENVWLECWSLLRR